MIEYFLPFVAGAARAYAGLPGIERVELLQEGVVGLLRALERFDPSRGVPFWGYASWWVRQAMQQLVSELTRPVILSDRALRQLAHVRDVHRELVAVHGREPSESELASGAALTGPQLAQLLAADRPAQALEQPLDAAEGATGTFGELLVDPLAEDEYERVLTAITIEQLRSLLSGLSERERTVLRARFGLGCPVMTLREIASTLGLSSERVRQIEQRALGKLRAAAAGP